jgi:hypothetical protein
VSQKVAHASGLRVLGFASGTHALLFTVLSLELKPRLTRDFPPDARYFIGVSAGAIRRATSLADQLRLQAPDRLPSKSPVTQTIE